MGPSRTDPSPCPLLLAPLWVPRQWYLMPISWVVLKMLKPPPKGRVNYLMITSIYTPGLLDGTWGLTVLPLYDRALLLHHQPIKLCTSCNSLLLGLLKCSPETRGGILVFWEVVALNSWNKPCTFLLHSLVSSRLALLHMGEQAKFSNRLRFISTYLLPIKALHKGRIWWPQFTCKAVGSQTSEGYYCAWRSQVPGPIRKSKSEVY